LKQFEDYGCPDWRDADGYGDFELWDDVNWRWQFKRRWRDYRIVFGNLCYQNHLECYPDRPIPVFPMWMPEYRDAYFFASPAQAARFDFPRLFNPLNANLPDHQWDALRDATTRFERRTVTAADFINNKDTKHKPRDVFGSGSIAITFNLYSPIRAQLDGLEDYLKEQQHYTAHKIFSGITVISGCFICVFWMHAKQMQLGRNALPFCRKRWLTPSKLLGMFTNKQCNCKNACDLRQLLLSQWFHQSRCSMNP
jgi:hypothetical protein